MDDFSRFSKIEERLLRRRAEQGYTCNELEADQGYTCIELEAELGYTCIESRLNKGTPYFIPRREKKSFHLEIKFLRVSHLGVYKEREFSNSSFLRITPAKGYPVIWYTQATGY